MLRQRTAPCSRRADTAARRIDIAGRMIWVDAKYKAHLSLLARYGWSGLSDAVRDAHRADLHQALAYSALSSADQIDSVLAYPQLGERSDEHRQHATVATLASGRRRVR